MSMNEAVAKLFVAFGAQRNLDQAALYVAELRNATTCSDCAEIAVENIMRSAKRLPSLAVVLDELRDVVRSDVHLAHISNPQLAPRSETWWRSEAVKIILPAADGDRNLAAFVAGQMWWSGVLAEHDLVAMEIEETSIWIDGARAFLANRDSAEEAERVFRRARWANEHHPSEVMPPELVALEGS